MGGRDHVGAGQVDLGVDRERGPVHGLGALDHLAVVVDEEEVGHADHAEVPAERVDPEVVEQLRVTRGDVARRALVVAELGPEPERRGQVAACGAGAPPRSSASGAGLRVFVCCMNGGVYGWLLRQIRTRRRRPLAWTSSTSAAASCRSAMNWLDDGRVNGVHRRVKARRRALAVEVPTPTPEPVADREDVEAVRRRAERDERWRRLAANHEARDRLRLPRSDPRWRRGPRR